MIYVVAVFLFLLASLLLFPIGLGLDYSEQGRRWYVLWMWLPIPVPAFVMRRTQAKKEKEESAGAAGKDDDKKPKERKSIGEKVQALVDGMSTGLEMFESGLATLRSVTHHLKIRVRRLHVVLATPNPALTGFGYGVMCAFGGIFASIPLAVEPEFTRTTSKVDFRVDARITVIKMVPAAWRMWRTTKAIKKRRAEATEEHKP